MLISHEHSKAMECRSSLVVPKNGLGYLIPHVILHLVIYRLSIFLKVADNTTTTEFDVSI